MFRNIDYNKLDLENLIDIDIEEIFFKKKRKKNGKKFDDGTPLKHNFKKNRKKFERVYKDK